MSAHVRTFGGWRERRGFGVGSLTGPQTAAGLVMVLVALACVMVVPAALPLLALPMVVAAALIAVRVRGETVAGVLSRHLRWRVSVKRGATAYDAVDTIHLPGVLADVQIHELGHAVVWNGARRTATLLVPIEPTGATLVEAEELRGWVGGWGDWLTHLGYVENLLHVVVTVHTQPQPALPQTSPGHGLVGEVMAELRAQTTSASLAQTVLSLTVKARDLAAACTHLDDVMAGMSALNRCGVSVLGAWTTPELVTWVRQAFDPQTLPGPGTSLPDARPTAVREHWSRYQHDTGVSAAFMWDECPGESMSATALTRLLAPANYTKRVSLVFEPVPAHQAAREVDRQAEAAAFRSQYRRRLGRDETARERLDVEKARQTAHDQASGSGLVDVGLYAVATGPDEQQLEACAADLHNRAGESRIRLRRAYGAQASCFAVTLGLGYVPLRGWSA